MEDVILPHICLHRYANVHGIKDEFKASNRMDETIMINSLVSTTDDIKSWMDTNHLKMNGAKWSLSHLQQENNFQNARSLKSLWITVSSKEQVPYIILEHDWTNI